MVARALAIIGVIVTMLVLSPGTASATGCVQVHYGQAGTTTGRCGTVVSVATWVTVGVVVGVVLGYALVQGQRAVRAAPRPAEKPTAPPKPAQPPKPAPAPPVQAPPRRPPPPPPRQPPPRAPDRFDPRRDLDDVYKFQQTLEDAAVALVETRPSHQPSGPQVSGFPVEDWGAFGALGVAVFAIGIARRIGGGLGRRLSQLNARLAHDGPRDHLPERGARGAVRSLIVGTYAGQYLANRGTDDLAEIAALASAACGILVCRRFASPRDVRIRPFADSLAALTGTAHGVAPQLIEATIRGMLGDQAQLRTIPPDQLTVTQVLTAHAILVEHSATPQQVEAVLDIAEPMAHLAARSPAVA